MKRPDSVAPNSCTRRNPAVTPMGEAKVDTMGDTSAAKKIRWISDRAVR